MQWYKSHVSLRKNPIYKRLSDKARQAFRNAMDAVAEYEQGDRLELRIGPLTEQELADDLVVSVRDLPKVLAELEASGFFIRGEKNVWSIAKFTEKTESHADRQRRYRAAKKAKEEAERLNGDASDDNGDASRVTVTGDGNGDKPSRVTDHRSREKREEYTDTNVSGAERTPNEVWSFAEWLRGEALTLGLLSANTEEDTPAIRADLKASATLLAHGRQECELRARRMLEAIATGEIKRCLPTCRSLQKCWDWSCVAVGKVKQFPGYSKPEPFGIPPERIF